MLNTEYDMRCNMGYDTDQDISDGEYQRQLELLVSAKNNIEDFFQHLNFDNLPTKGSKQLRLESNKNVAFLSNKRQKFT